LDGQAFDVDQNGSRKMSEVLLRASRLTIGYGEALLPPVSFDVRPGELWAVVGRNGSGKTTLFRTLLGLHDPLGGEIERARGLLPAYIPQRAALDPIVPLTVFDVVSLGMDRGWSFLRPAARYRKAHVHEALERVGAVELSKQQFHELSEGQKQRVLLARVLAGRANMAFLDEPTAAMDAVAEKQSMETIDRLRREHALAVVIVSHFLGVARTIADKVLFLDRELQVAIAGRPAEVFASEPFKRRYGDAA
jgi:zinc transport system ATP-binding protein